MKLTRNRVLIAALGIMLVSAVAVSQAFGGPGGMHGHGSFSGHMLGFFADYLDLTDAQQAQMKQIMEKEKPNMQPLFQQLGQNRQQLRQLEESGTFDEAKVRALAAQNSQAMIELTVQRARIHSEMLQVLTPDQRTKYAQFMQKRAARFQKWNHDPAQPPQ